MNRIHKIAVGASVLSLGLLGVGAAVAANPPENAAAQERANVPFTAAAAWHGSSENASAKGLSLVDGLANTYDDEAGAASESSLARFPDGGELAVVPTRKGGLCFQAARGDRDLSALCTPKFNDNGTQTVYRMATGERSELVGVVDRNVDSVSLTLDDGSKVEVPIVDGTIMWVAPPGRDAVTITTDRGGKIVDEKL